jgi:heme A synthase
MQDLALIVSLMLFIPIAVGIAAIVFSIVQRKNPKLRTFALVLTGIVGTTAVLGLIQYVPLGIVPAFETLIAVLFLFVPKSNAGRGLED